MHRVVTSYTPVGEKGSNINVYVRVRPTEDASDLVNEFRGDIGRNDCELDIMLLGDLPGEVHHQGEVVGTVNL